jgi:hypothetical protein
MKYKRRVINKQDWVGLRLLFMGSAVENSLTGVEDWNRCHRYFITKYGIQKIQRAFELLNEEYRATNEFKLSKLAWGQHVHVSRDPERDWSEIPLIHIKGHWRKP